MTLKKTFLLTISCFYYLTSILAQSGCPGCLISLPDLPADTVFLGAAPEGQVGVYYDGDVSFRMPQTTTPVAATDPSVPPGIDIDKITITAVTNVPPGLSWETDHNEFDLPDETDGCVKFCGVPLQPGLYLVNVVITAEVLFISQESSFVLPVMINPSVSASEGFSMVNNSGCGEVRVSFENNIPSQGNDGYSYFWDFGNGFSTVAENPQDVTYDEPGTYEVNYQAIVDTFGFFLANVVIESVGCNDIFNNAPDLFVKVFDPEGEEIISTPTIQNASTPLSVNLNLNIGPGNYSLQVLDNDSGLGGGDDLCGTINFNQQSNGTLIDNDMTVSLHIFNLIDTIQSVDTVTVFFQPDPPIITGAPDGTVCQGESYVLTTNYASSNQWYRDSVPMVDSVFSTLTVRDIGQYWVVHTTDEGCTATSEIVMIDVAPLPDLPAFENDNNLLFVVNPEELPEQYDLQWYLNGFAIIDATALEYCVATSGTYSLVVTNAETGCSKSSFLLDVVYNPNFPGCVTSLSEIEGIFEQPFRAYPNPTSGSFSLTWETIQSVDLSFRLLNAFGAALYTLDKAQSIGSQNLQLDLADFPAGLYILEWKMENEKGLIKVVKQ